MFMKSGVPDFKCACVFKKQGGLLLRFGDPRDSFSSSVGSYLLYIPHHVRGMGNCVLWCGWRRQPTTTRTWNEPAVGALGAN